MPLGIVCIETCLGYESVNLCQFIQRPCVLCLFRFIEVLSIIVVLVQAALPLGECDHALGGVGVCTNCEAGKYPRKGPSASQSASRCAVQIFVAHARQRRQSARSVAC